MYCNAMYYTVNCFLFLHFCFQVTWRTINCIEDPQIKYTYLLPLTANQSKGTLRSLMTRKQEWDCAPSFCWVYFFWHHLHFSTRHYNIWPPLEALPKWRDTGWWHGRIVPKKQYRNEVRGSSITFWNKRVFSILSRFSYLIHDTKIESCSVIWK